MDMKVLIWFATLLLVTVADDDDIDAKKVAEVIIGNRTDAGSGPDIDFINDVIIGIQEMQIRGLRYSRQGAKTDDEMNKAYTSMRQAVGPKSNQTTTSGEAHPALKNFAYQGDMIVTGAQIDHIITGQANGTRPKRGATTNPNSYWTVGIPIPYEIDYSLNNLRTQIKAGLQFWMDHSCMKFVENPRANNRLRYYYGQGCWSYVGKQKAWASQDISIGDGCSSMGTICHETMHAMGFYHTQSNYDRDQYIYVAYNNIQPTLSYNFDKMTPATENLLGVSYDYGSVMQYPPYAFAVNSNQPTSMSIDPNYQNFMGQRDGPAFSDIKALNALYRCENQCYTKPTCYNNGIVNPNRCNSCLCPKYFGGNNCESLARGTAPVCNGKVIQATSTSWQYFTFTAGQGMTYAYAATSGTCFWMIQAPVGRRIQIQMRSTDTTCMESCPWAGMEINCGNLDNYGLMCCCQSFSKSIYTSIGNAIYMAALVRYNNMNMEMGYRVI